VVLSLLVGGLIKRVLLVGYDPKSVDFSDPALPTGMTTETICAGVQVALKQMTDRGWEADCCYVHPDQTAGFTVEYRLPVKTYDCVVIGTGVRLPPKGITHFEVIINAIRRAAPAAAIAFNTRPEDSADAAGRWLTPT
jgi:hypothetical protein